jgi:hypothetical protein
MLELGISSRCNTSNVDFRFNTVIVDGCVCIIELLFEIRSHILSGHTLHILSGAGLPPFIHGHFHDRDDVSAAILSPLRYVLGVLTCCVGERITEKRIVPPTTGPSQGLCVHRAQTGTWDWALWPSKRVDIGEMDSQISVPTSSGKIQRGSISRMRFEPAVLVDKRWTFWTFWSARSTVHLLVTWRVYLQRDKTTELNVTSMPWVVGEPGILVVQHIPRRWWHGCRDRQMFVISNRFY